jgi:hypothetical protein
MQINFLNLQAKYVIIIKNDEGWMFLLFLLTLSTAHTFAPLLIKASIVLTLSKKQAIIKGVNPLQR